MNKAGVLHLDVREKGYESEFYDWFFIDGDVVDIEKINYETFAYVYNMPKLDISKKKSKTI